jgi:hypothetical protein
MVMRLDRPAIKRAVLDACWLTLKGIPHKELVDPVDRTWIFVWPHDSQSHTLM